MPVFNNALAGAAGSGGAEAYKIERSLRFNKDKGSHLTKTQSDAGNRKKFTLSFWIKRGAFTSNTGRAIFYAGTNGQTVNRTGLLIGNAAFSGNGNSLVFGQDTAGAWQTMRETTALFRDHAAWAHIVVAVDTTIASPAFDRIKIYINGVLQEAGDFTTSNDPAQDHEFFINNNGDHFIGKDPGGYVGSLDANLADFQLINGEQLAATNFGEFDEDTGAWNPIEFTPSTEYSTSAITSVTSLTNSFTTDDNNDAFGSGNIDEGTYSRKVNGGVLTVTLSPAQSGNFVVYTGAVNENSRYTIIFEDSNGSTYTVLNNSTSPRTGPGNTCTVNAGQRSNIVGFTVDCQDANDSQLCGVTLDGNRLVNGSAYGKQVTLTDGTNLNEFPVNTVVSNGDKVIARNTTNNTLSLDGTSWATGQVVTKGGYGTNGFHLDFNDDKAVGRDATSNDTPLPCVDFDGNDHLQIAYHSDFNLGSSDFTIECYAKTTDATTNYPSIVGRWKGQGEAHWDFRPASDDASHNFFFIYHDGTNNNQVNSGTSITDGKWHHLAVARDGANLRMFVDGALVHTHNIGTATISNTTSVPLFLGWDQWGSSYYKGQTSNLRIVVGTALYTSTFTKPTTPLTNVTNTKLLCFQSDTSVETAAVTPNPLVIKSGDPEAASVADSDWTAANIQRLSTTNGNYLANLSISEGSATYYGQTRDEYLGSFNGSTVGAWDFARNSTANVTGKIEFPGGRTVNSSLELWIGESWNISGYGTYQKFVSINGGTFNEIGSSSTSNADATTTWRTFTVPGGTLNSIEVRTATSYGGGWGRGFASAIRIDGEILTDHSLRLDDDVSKDSPTNYEADTGNNGGNYCVLNPLDHVGATFADGNLKVNLSNGNHIACGTMGMPYGPGKYYWEVTVNTAGTAVPVMIGMANVARTLTDRMFQEEGWYYYGANGQAYHQGSGSNMGDTYGAGDVIGVAVDCGFGTQSITFYKNGVSQGTPYSYSHYNWYNDTVIPVINNPNSGGNINVICNFGARPFNYTPPTGYKPLCTKDFSDPLIAKPSTAFDVALYTGNGTTGQSITGLEFSPDLVWFKERSSSGGHSLVDTIRGVTKPVMINTNTEYTKTEFFDSFDSNGFTVDYNGVDSSLVTNRNNQTYAAWAWDAGDAANPTSNTDGSVTSQVRVNQTAGFSIVSWTASNSANGTYDTIGHGLNATPGLVLTKRRNVSDSWYSAHGFDLTQFATLNSQGAFASAGTAWGNGITSSVIGMRIGNFVGANDAMIAYCFAPVTNYSAFGSYEGNSSSDGPFVYTGFRPRWIMYKWADGSGEWAIRDTARSAYNVSDQVLSANTSGAEQDHSVWNVDILSNGFKIRTSSAGSNSSSTFIYAAFAESPLKYARAR